MYIHTHTKENTITQPTYRPNKETAGRETSTQLLHTHPSHNLHMKAAGKGTNEMKFARNTPTHKKVQDAQGQQARKQVHS